MRQWHRRFLLTTRMTVAASGGLWFALHDPMTFEPGELLRTLLVAHGVASLPRPSLSARSCHCMWSPAADRGGTESRAFRSRAPRLS